MSQYKDVIESALSEADSQFDRLSTELATNSLIDILELSLISIVSFALVGIGLIIRSLITKLGIMERSQIRLQDLGNRNKLDNLLTIIKINQPENKQQDDRFLEL